MLPFEFVFIGATLGISGTLMYAWNTFKGRTQPNRVSWALWTIAPMLAAASEIRSHADWQWVTTVVIGLGPAAVVVASFAKSGAVWKLGPFDLACGAASVGGLAAWAVTSNDTVALAAFIGADMLAALPTIRKAWREPATESAWAFGPSLLSCLVTLSTVTVWSAANSAFVLWITVLDGLLLLLISGKIGPRIRREHTMEVGPPLERVLRPRKEAPDVS